MIKKWKNDLKNDKQMIKNDKKLIPEMIKKMKMIK